MAKAVYSLKIFLFRKQFSLSAAEWSGLRQVCIYIVVIHVKNWFTAPLASAAPRNDLQLLKDLIKYREINQKVSEVALLKMKNHLWYLAENVLPLALFDDDLSADSKRIIVEKISKQNVQIVDVNSLDIMNADIINNLTVDKLITTNSKKFFTTLNLSSDFLNFDPSTWENIPGYVFNRKIVQNLQVINDRAERCVSLMNEYNLILTRDEEKKQSIMKIVKKFREHYVNYNKKTLQKNLLDYYIFQKKENNDTHS